MSKIPAGFVRARIVFEVDFPGKPYVVEELIDVHDAKMFGGKREWYWKLMLGHLHNAFRFTLPTD